MSDEEREAYAAACAADRARPPSSTRPTRRSPLDGQPMPRPFAAYAPDTITLGSASKSFWGGLRLGWVRAPHDRMDR